jgi:pimeloyl-ACP methyl ester carboxylesterase
LPDKLTNRKLTDYWRRAMKSRQAMRAVAGVLLCGAGVWLALPSPYRERTYIFNADGCNLETTIVEKPLGGGHGSLLLFHGISANKKIMAYWARGFAEQGLRVYVPDLPGHGRTPGPFSPAHAQQCGEALLRELLTRGIVTADRTILAGHSMGGAIVERIAARVPVAGLIGISPAPMRAAHGVTAEKLLFSDPPDLPSNSLVLVGALEVAGLRKNAFDLAATRSDGTTKYEEVPRASHVTVLFSSVAMRSAQEWAAWVLHLPPPTGLPSHRSLIGSLAGFLGILLIAGPFLRELAGKNKTDEQAAAAGVSSVPRLLLEFGAGSALIVLLLRCGRPASEGGPYSGAPLKAIGLFQGDYLASFLLFLGALLVMAHWRAVRLAIANSSRLLAAGFAGIVLLLLSTAWFDLTFYEAWLTAAKWARFPFLLAALLPYHLTEETLLGPVAQGKRGRRLAVALTLRLITWGAMMGGVFLLHSGEILIGLLGGYLALFNIVQRSGMDIVRTETGSATAAALFGAILLAGFCLVIFPLT